MRIATLSNAAVGHTQRWVAWFRGRGHEVAVWSLERGPAALGAHLLASPPLPGALRYPLAAPSLARALARFAPDVVDAHYVPNYGLLGVLAGARPLAVSAWGSDLLLAGGGDPLRRARTRFVLRRADLVLADARNLAAAARSLGAPPERVACIPWGVDLAHFRPADAREPGLVVSTRMHEPVYDIPRIVDAAAIVMAHRPEARFVFVGDGSLRRALERRAAERLPAGRFEFRGLVDAATLASLLARAEVAVSASLSDSTSVTLLESMACGAVPVVSDLEGNREWIEDGLHGRLVPPGVEALAAAIEAALADDAWRARARTAGRALVEGRADRERNMGEIESRFRALAASRPRRAPGAGG